MKKKVLIADDDPGLIMVIKERLEANNYEVFPIRDAKDIMLSVKKYNPDVIILDIVMPDLNGYEVCKFLKNDKDAGGIPIILFTGKELKTQGIVKRCLDLGVEQYFLKPVDSKILIESIEKLTTK